MSGWLLFSFSPPQCVWALSTSLISCCLLVALDLSFSGTLDTTCRRLKQHKALENRSWFSSHVCLFQAHLSTLSDVRFAPFHSWPFSENTQLAIYTGAV